ncbi:MAG: Trm112 family protein [Inquilinaceae bacterium]
MTDDTPLDPAATGGPGADAPRPVPVDPKLLEILVCPLTKAPLRYDSAAQELISDQAGLAYPIRDGIPIMLVDEARPLDPDTAR